LKTQHIQTQSPKKKKKNRPISAIKITKHTQSTQKPLTDVTNNKIKQKNPIGNSHNPTQHKPQLKKPTKHKAKGSKTSQMNDQKAKN
jgi:hypothetical protein